MDDDNDDDERTNPNYLMASSLPVALIAGDESETTVTLPSSDNDYSGKGERNQENGTTIMVLLMMIQLMERIYWIQMKIVLRRRIQYASTP